MKQLVLIKFKLFIAILLLSVSVYAQLPTCQWAKSFGGKNNENITSMKQDASGNIYFTGTFSSSDLALGSTTLTNSGGIDFFIAKSDPNGNILWVKNAVGSGDDYSNSISLDASGNAFITGNYTSPSLSFAGSTIVNNGKSNIFLAKYDPNGNILWIKNAGGIYYDYANSVTVDSSGNAYITGVFSSSSILFGTVQLKNSGMSDFFITKYNSSGNVVWAKSATGNFNNEDNYITNDNSGNIIVTGEFISNTVKFGTITLTNSDSLSSSDIYYVKYNSAGTLIWAKSFGTSKYENVRGIATDKTGNIFLTGYFEDSELDLGSSKLISYSFHDFFLTKINPSGNIIWAKNGQKSNFIIESYSVAIDSLGNSYITGCYCGSYICLGGYKIYSQNKYNNNFLISYDINGNINWVTNFEGFGDGTGLANCVSINNDGNIIVGGRFSYNRVKFGSIVIANSDSSDYTCDFYISKYSSAIGSYILNAGSDQTIIKGRSAVLCAVGATSYSWSNGATTASITVAPTITTIYKVTGTKNGISATSQVIVTVIEYEEAPGWALAKRAGGDKDESLNSSAVDSNGNLYIAGSFNSPDIKFDSITLTKTGSSDLFITKYDIEGKVLWAKKIECSSGGGVNSIKFDKSGNILIVGVYSDTIKLGSTTLTNANGDKVFITKLDQNGNFLWAKSTQGNLTSVALDKLGNIYMTGFFGYNKTLKFGNVMLSAGYYFSLYLVKFDSNGNALWAKGPFGMYCEYMMINTDFSGNIYLSGIFSDLYLTFGSDTLKNASFLSTGLWNNVFLVKFDQNGNVLWNRSGGGADDDCYVTSFDVDKAGNSYLYGYFRSSTVTFGSLTLYDQSSSDMFIIKYNTNGNIIFAKNISGDNLLYASIDTLGNSYVLARVYEPDFLNFGSDTLSDRKNYYIFISKYDINGNPLWQRNTIFKNWIVGQIAKNSAGNIFITGYYNDSVVKFGHSVLNNADKTNCSQDIFIAKLGVYAGDDQTICSGQSIAFNATGATNYSWSTGSVNTNITISPTVTTTYKVTGTNNSLTSTGIVKVTVNHSPIIYVNNSTICSGENATLTATGASTYSWSTGSLSSSLSLSPTVTSTFIVTGTDNNGCSNTSTSIITVNAKPTANAGPDKTISLGNSISLVASGGTAYSWSTNASTQSITVSPVVTTTYFVTVNSAAGCSGTDAVIVTVNSLVSYEDTICLGNSTTLTASGGVYYQWSTGSRLSSITVSPTITTTYKVTVRRTVFSSDVKQIVVTVDAFTPRIVPDQKICKGSSTALTASGGATYSWNTGATTSSITVNPIVLKLYVVTISNGGCTASDVVVVKVNSSPSINAGSDKTICKGSTVSITSSGGKTYTWSSGQNTSSITVSPLLNTTYTVTANSLTGCSSFATVRITVYSLPVVNAGDDMTICKGSEAILTATGGDFYQWSTGLRNASVTVNPMATTTYTVTVVSNTTGCANKDDIVVFVNNCKYLSDLKNIGEINESTSYVMNVNIYPNPSNGLFTVEINNYPKEFSGTLIIKNILGENVFKEIIKTNAGIYKYDIDIQNMATGIYNLIISDQDVRVFKNIIKD